MRLKLLDDQRCGVRDEVVRARGGDQHGVELVRVDSGPGKRASAGLRSLKWDGALGSLARWRSKDMIQRNYFSHAIPPSRKAIRTPG